MAYEVYTRDNAHLYLQVVNDSRDEPLFPISFVQNQIPAFF